MGNPAGRPAQGEGRTLRRRALSRHEPNCKTEAKATGTHKIKKGNTISAIIGISRAEARTFFAEILRDGGHGSQATAAAPFRRSEASAKSI
jgi:hypothetical protein